MAINRVHYEQSIVERGKNTNVLVGGDLGGSIEIIRYLDT